MPDQVCVFFFFPKHSIIYFWLGKFVGLNVVGISWWTFSGRTWIFFWGSSTRRDCLRFRILFINIQKRNHTNNLIYLDSLILRIWQIFRRRFTSRERWERECICIGENRDTLKPLYENVFTSFFKLISIRRNCLFLKNFVSFLLIWSWSVRSH